MITKSEESLQYLCNKLSQQSGKDIILFDIAYGCRSKGKWLWTARYWGANPEDNRRGTGPTPGSAKENLLAVMMHK